MNVVAHTLSAHLKWNHCAPNAAVLFMVMNHANTRLKIIAASNATGTDQPLNI